MTVQRLLRAGLLLLLSTAAPAILAERPATPPGYVVIGAFASEQNAEHFTASARDLKYEAKYEINPARKLFYVYVLQTQDIRAAIVQATKLQKDSPWHDTWVFIGYLGASGAGSDIDPLSGQQKPVVEKKEEPVAVVQEQIPVQPVVQESPPVVQEEKQPEVQVNKDPVTETPSQPFSIVPATRLDGDATDVPGGKGFYFKVYSGKGQELKGEVEMVDADKVKKFRDYDANKRVSVAPINKSGNLHLVANAFGYRKQQIEINYNAPLTTEGVKEENGVVVVPFEMVRLKKGDIAILYNVLFYKDAAIMRPDSKYEVTTLLEMMNENPQYRIMLHGHTNGNSMGTIIEMGDDKNFFSLTNSKEGYGSSKKLSEERALVIKEFLVANGVDANRIEVTAWGGKKPIHDKKSNRAHENVRVEVEILQD